MTYDHEPPVLPGESDPLLAASTDTQTDPNMAGDAPGGDWRETAAFVALGIAVGTFMGAVMRDLGVPSFARVVVIAAAFYVALVWWRRNVP